MFSPLTFRAAALAGLAALAGCRLVELEPVTNPNNPNLESVVRNASRAQLDALGVGVEAALRLAHVNNAPNNWVTGSLGREIFVLATNESRWFQEILGTRGTLDESGFYNNTAYTNFAVACRAAKIFTASANATAVVTAAQQQGIAGFAHTYEALAKLHLLVLQGENGIRIDVDNHLKPGKFVSYTASLAHIRALLDQGAAELAAAGPAFAFPLSTGYAGPADRPAGVAGASFNTPATFRQVNRALAARVALYQGDHAGALTALAASFYDPAASLDLGPKIVFNPTTAGDASNPYFQVANGDQPALVVAAENFVTEAEPGDQRLTKAPLRTGTARTLGGISGRYEVRLYPTPTTPIDIIRNEELVLIAAEAHAATGHLAEAVAALNVVRTRAGGLPPRPAASFAQPADYLDEILKQRRYSLFYENHRWFDLRRLQRFTPTPAPGQTLAHATGGNAAGSFRLFDRLERPFAEKQWDIANP